MIVGNLELGPRYTVQYPNIQTLPARAVADNGLLYVRKGFKNKLLCPFFYRKYIIKRIKTP